MTRIKHDDTLRGSKRKAQKQPARRARRSRPCKHEWCEVTIGDALGISFVRKFHERISHRAGPVFSVRCSDCGEQLWLGPSNDEPVAVQIEMRAAELEPIWGLKLMSTLIERSQGEIDGGDCHSMHALGETRGGDYPATLNAGWLAREMATHDDREARDRDASAWPWDPTRPMAGQYEEWFATPVYDPDDDPEECPKCGGDPLDHDSSCEERAPHAEIEVIAGPEPETGVEVPIETNHICSDRSLDCAACDVADDDEDDGTFAQTAPETCTPASCAPACPPRVRSDDPTPVESEIGGEA